MITLSPRGYFNSSLLDWIWIWIWIYGLSYYVGVGGSLFHFLHELGEVLCQNDFHLLSLAHPQGEVGKWPNPERSTRVLLLCDVYEVNKDSISYTITY